MTVEIPGYKIVSTLGKGGMATVYLAEQEIFERKVALKVMARGLADDPSFGQRFLREARIVSQLVHPNIVTVYDVGVHEGSYYLSMEYIDGQDLKHARQRLSLERGIQIILDVAKALEYAGNKGYVHRDIKPENIMLYTEDSRAVLTDFGIARVAEEADASVTQTGTAIGTPHYMSPEQAKGQPVDIRSDLYSLGVVFYLLAVGHVPFDAESAVAIGIKHITEPVPRLPDGLTPLQPIVDKLLAKEPSDRYQRAGELVNDLQRLNVPELEADAEEAREHGVRENLETADADAPTMVSSPLARAHTPIHQPPVEPNSFEEQPFEVDEEDGGGSGWAWMAGLVILLVVAGGVVYLQYPEMIQRWMGEGRGRITQILDGDRTATQAPASPAPTPSDTVVPTPTAEVAATLEQPTVEPAPDPALQALRRRIEALQGQVGEDPSQLRPLVEAWRELDSLTPKSIGAEAALADLLENEMVRIRSLARAGDVDAANHRLVELRFLFPDQSSATFDELETFVRRQQEVGRLLKQARELLAEDALTLPEGENALARYQQILSLAPDNEAALNGVARVADRLVALARQSLDAGNPARAGNLLTRALEVAPGHQEALNLQSSAEAAAEQQRDMAQLLKQGRRQLERGNYFEPASDNAYHYFRQALQAQPGNSDARAGVDRAIAGLRAQVFEHIDNERFEAARQLLSTPQSVLPANEAIAALALAADEAIAEQVLAQQPRVSHLVVSGQPIDSTSPVQPATLQAERTIFIYLRYENFAAGTTVLQAVLMDGGRTTQITQVPVVVSGTSGSNVFRIDRPVEGFSSGSFVIDLQLQGKSLTSRVFKVE